MTARLEQGPRGLVRIPRAAPLRAASRCSKCASAPAARTRFACIFRASAIRWPATRCTARRRRSRACRRWAATSCTRTASASTSPPTGEEVTVVSPLPRGAGGDWMEARLIAAERHAIIRQYEDPGLLLAATGRLLLAPRGRRAASPPPQRRRTQADEPTRISVDVTRVNMLFTVTDKKGRFVTDLTKDDFEVHRKQEAADHPGVHRRKRPAAAPRRPDRYQQQHSRPLPVRAGSRQRVPQERDARQQDKAMVVSFDTTPNWCPT